MARIFLLALLFSASTMFGQSSKRDFASRVNPMIGTGGHGHTYPGALVPFGMMQLSPDTRLDGWDGCSGYHYSDTVIYGFSHTHLSGTGCSDYGDILLMPSGNGSTYKYEYASSFSKKSEKAQAGYYHVFLDKPKADAELTATARCGMHRYTFAKRAHTRSWGGDEGIYLIVDLKHRDEVLDSRLEAVDSVTLRGYRFSKAWAGNQKVFFEIKFSKPFLSVVDGDLMFDWRHKHITAKGKNVIRAFSFKNDGRPLLVKVAISAVDEAGAHKNMMAEMPGWNFDYYRAKAHTVWNKELSKLDAHGGTADQQTVFYTALYHCMSAPNIYSDVDNRYRGRDDKIHSTEGKFDYYTVFSLWDTYRAEHPLLTQIDPKRTNDFINTFIAQYEQGGELPVWELSSNETYCMIGYHAVSVIWDAYSKGIRGYDIHKAFEAMKHSAMMAHFGLDSYRKWGFVRADDESESVSKTLEYAYDDWCIAQMAWALKDQTTYYQFINRSQSWRNVYDPTTGFMRARKNGTLYTPFSPYAVDGNYTEANAWQYSFYVPQDIDGLIAVMGGREKFESKLDDLFAAKTKTEGREQPDISGLIGQYAHGNEPSHHIAYLYNYVGKPEKTRAMVKYIMDSFYHDVPDGLIGNEDCGQMSAWYVMSAMGIYPVCPGLGNHYEAGYALFDSVILRPAGGAAFTIKYRPADTVNSWPGHLLVSVGMQEDQPERMMICNPEDGRTSHYAPVPPLYYEQHGEPVREYLAAVPFIVDAKPIFKDSAKIVLACLDSIQSIVYTMDEGADFQFYPYKKPFWIKKNSRLRFYSIKHISASSISYSFIQEACFIRLPSDRDIILHSTYNKSYCAGGPEALIDGQHGNTNWRTGGWQGYQGQDFEAIVALKAAARAISSVKVSFLEDQRAWIFYPTTISFYASDDSLHWQLTETVPTLKSDHNLAITTSTFESKKPVTARFIKVVAKSFGKMPDWHEGRGEPTFIFIDEIEVK